MYGGKVCNNANNMHAFARGNRMCVLHEAPNVGVSHRRASRLLSDPVPGQLPWISRQRTEYTGHRPPSSGNEAAA